MKVAILGASGIVGQHMRLAIPKGIKAVWTRRRTDIIHQGVDLRDLTATNHFLAESRPDVIVNLAGENRVDVVEQFPDESYAVNALAPEFLARWCYEHNSYYLHVSTQAVFSGDEPPYFPISKMRPINAYGRQKAEAEHRVAHVAGSWTIVRLTFVLGLRPWPDLGRPNPVEFMLNGQPKQVADRFFSICFAPDAARDLWAFAMTRQGGIYHLGITGCTSRYGIASALGVRAEPVNHSDFAGLASRPVNTAYGSTRLYQSQMKEGLAAILAAWEPRKVPA